MLKIGPELAHEITDPHAVAAFCLHDQPFGFTRERLAALGRVLGAAMSMATATKDDMKLVRSDYNRIEALLPPEEGTRT